MIDFINVKAEQLEKFLREEGNEIFDFYILTDKYGLGKGHRSVNVYEMEALFPYMTELKHDSVINTKRSHKVYKEMLERKSIRGALSKVILDNIITERPMVFITSDEDKEFPWFLHVFEMLHDRYGIKVRSYSEYRENRTPNMRTIMDDDTISNLTIDKFAYIDDAIGASENMAVQDNTTRSMIPYDEPIYVKDARFEDVIDIGVRLNIYYDGGSEEEFRNKVMKAVIETEKKQAPTKSQMLRMNLPTVYRIISQYKLNIPHKEEYTFEELVDKTDEMIKALNNDDTKYSIQELNNMSLRMLDKIALMKGIDVRKTNKTSAELIMAICNKDGVKYDSSIVDSETLISEEDIKYLNEDELMAIAMRMKLSVPSFVGKNHLVDIIVRTSRFKYTTEKLSCYTRYDLEKLDKRDLATLLYNLDLYDSVEEALDIVPSKTVMIDELVRECKMDDYKEQVRYTIDEMRNMSKEQLIRIAKGYNIAVTSLDRRSYIANQINKYYKRISPNRRNEKVVKRDYKELLGYTTKELKSFCEKNDIDVEPDMSKKELAKMIVKIDYNLRKGRDVILNNDINIDDFNIDNLLKEDKKSLLDFVEFNNINVDVQNPTKEELAYHISEVLNPDSVEGYTFRGIDEEITDKEKKVRHKDIASKIREGKKEVFTSFSDEKNEFDLIMEELYSPRTTKKQRDDISKVIIDDAGNRVLKTKKKSIYSDIDFIKVDDDLRIEDGYVLDLDRFLNKN